MQSAMENAEKDDPLIRAKIGARAIKEILYEALGKNDAKGVHVDTVLGILGSMAGFSCLLLAYLAQQAGHGKDDPLAIVTFTGADGKKYFFGNLSNGPLLEQEHSVWSLVAGISHHLGSSKTPDVLETIKHVSATAGGELFGIPRMPEGHNMSDMPRNYVRDLWPILIKDVKAYTSNPSDWPILFAVAAQQVIQESQEVIDPGLAAQIVMECAIPMSKIDPNSAV